MLYTAMSRSTEKKNINFVNYYPKVSTGYIYKITNNLNNKLYIGSTKTTIEQRFNEHRQTRDTSPLHQAIQKDGIEHFTIEVVQTVQFVDEQQLLIYESTQMIEHDTLNGHYNTKLACDLVNIF